MNKEAVAKKMAEDFDYTEEDLLTNWEWINIDQDSGMWGNVFFDGSYVFFAEDKVIWHTD